MLERNEYDINLLLGNRHSNEILLFLKIIYVGSDAFQLGVCDAVPHFSIENQAIIKIIEALGINPGSYFLTGVHEADCCRVKKANYKRIVAGFLYSKFVSKL